MMLNGLPNLTYNIRHQGVSNSSPAVESQKLDAPQIHLHTAALLA